MMRSLLLQILPVALVCAAVLVVEWARCRNATESLRAADHRLASVLADADELQRLRSTTPFIGDSSLPDDALVSHVRASLTLTGLPDTRLSQLSRPPDQPLRSADTGAQTAPLMTRTEVIVLEPITLAELGRWLSLWRDTQPSWIPTQIQLRANSRPRASYSARIHLSTVFTRRQTAEAGI